MRILPLYLVPLFFATLTSHAQVKKKPTPPAKKPKYEQVDDYYKGYANVKKAGKYGAINAAGREVVPCIYEKPVYVQDGFAPIVKDGKKGIADTNNRESVPCIYDDMKLRYEESVAQWNELIIVYKDGKCGAIDKYGKVLTPLIYDKIDDNSAVVYGGDMLRAATIDGKTGYIGRDGAIVIPPVFDELRWLGTCCFAARQGQQYGLKGTDGSTILPVKYYGMGEKIVEGMICIMNKRSEWGFADTLGNVRVPCKYEEQTTFHGGIAKVLLEGKEVYINRKGEILNGMERGLK